MLVTVPNYTDFLALVNAQSRKPIIFVYDHAPTAYQIDAFVGAMVIRVSTVTKPASFDTDFPAATPYVGTYPTIT